jgi:hypothetical protein
MRRRNIWTALSAAVFLLALAAPSTLPQKRMAQGKGMPKYDAAAEVTLRGAVEEVTQHKGRMGRTGTHLLVNFDGRSMAVHLGPTSYLERNNFAFAKGDQVEVTGSKVRMGDADVLLAREVKAGDRTLKLRDAQGMPLWSGGGSRNP